MIDALTVRALGAELQGTTAGGHVQNVYFVSPRVIGLELYANRKRHFILASAEPSRARLLLVAEKIRSASVPLTPFFLLLKKYVHGAFLNRVQVVARERILHFEFDHHAQGVSKLVVELMGNRTNFILLDAGGAILDALRRVPSSANRAREIVPRARYYPPPPQAKADPLQLTAAQLRALLDKASEETLAERLVAAVAGTSPLFARELAFRAAGAADALYDAALVNQLHTELTRVWNAPAAPSLAFENGQPAAVAAFVLTHFETREEIPSMSAALERFFGAEESYSAVKLPLREQLARALEKMERTRTSLQRELVSNAEIEILQLKGKMILGYQYELAQGQTEFRAQVSDDVAIQIALEPNLSPVENAQRYFDEYKRARDARARVPERLTGVANDIAYTQQLLLDLELAESRAEIDQVVEQAREMNLLHEPRLRVGRAPHSEPRRYISPDGFQILVGRNARQNDALTFERAKADDVWLHARGRAGSHVVILSSGKAIPQTTLQFGAALAAYFSQARNENAVDVVYTPRQNVHRVRGAHVHPGLVTVRAEQVIRVRPAAALEAQND